MEPTVFYIDECDNLYSTAKWLGKKEDNPARWMSFFPALMKMVKNGDRMVLIGETHNPFNCKRPQMFSMFKNVLLFTIPEYGSRTAIWSAFLARLPAFKASTLNVSVLSKMTEGYTAREIQFVVDNVLHADRISRKRAVTNEEFLQCLGFMGKPPDVTEVWTNWYMSTPMVKQHMDWLRAMDELDELLDSEE
ncbi:dynein regulatory complex protein 11-like [Physella acuta]|uniref:dynein regulatory complex protein 11-like n=1 Tax=Physella acuta TaxID=109671 RepID=UPI0027DD9EE3|nr:dynein regulatory complex protein 11-like [Physella acuta]